MSDPEPVYAATSRAALRQREVEAVLARVRAALDLVGFRGPATAVDVQVGAGRVVVVLP